MSIERELAYRFNRVTGDHKDNSNQKLLLFGILVRGKMLQKKIERESNSGEEKGGCNYSCPYRRRVNQFRHILFFYLNIIIPKFTSSPVSTC